MPDKPTTAAGYSSEHAALVRATCLHVATKLGDLTDDVVVVGGLAPSLIIDQQALAVDADGHVGTMDLDVGLTVALLADNAAAEAISILRRDFLDHDGVGARRVAEFPSGGPDDGIQADTVGFVAALIQAIDDDDDDREPGK